MQSYLINTNPWVVDIPKGFAFHPEGIAFKAKDIDTLYFPKEIAAEIGMSKQRIAFLKNRGCKFHGRKTTIRAVREFLTAYEV